MAWSAVALATMAWSCAVAAQSDESSPSSSLRRLRGGGGATDLATAPAPARSRHGLLQLAELMRLGVRGVPSGSYSGAASVLGETITGHLVIESSTSVDLTLSGGGVELWCPGETYHMSGAQLVLDNLDDPEDCVAAALREYGVQFDGASYDDADDAITIDVTYGPLKLSIDLTKDARSSRSAVPPRPPPLGGLIVGTPLQQQPSGTYVGAHAGGSVRGAPAALAVSAVVDASLLSSATVDLAFAGPDLSVKCGGEAFDVAATGLVTFFGGPRGDASCLDDDLRRQGLQLASASYDDVADAITLRLAYAYPDRPSLRLIVTLVLNHVPVGGDAVDAVVDA